MRERERERERGERKREDRGSLVILDCTLYMYIISLPVYQFHGWHGSVVENYAFALQMQMPNASIVGQNI